MRHIFVAGLLLSPMLITSAAIASQPISDAKSTTPNTRISTGVIAPEINPSTFHIATSEYDRVLPSEVEVVVALNVDEQGNAHDLKVVKSVNPEFDARVIDAVQKSHFRPAKLDNQVVAYGMNLKVVVQR